MRKIFDFVLVAVLLTAFLSSCSTRGAISSYSPQEEDRPAPPEKMGERGRYGGIFWRIRWLVYCYRRGER